MESERRGVCAAGRKLKQLGWKEKPGGRELGGKTGALERRTVETAGERTVLFEFPLAGPLPERMALLLLHVAPQ